MVFVYRVGSSYFIYFFSFSFSMDDLALNDVALILGTDMDTNLSIEIHMKYNKLLILKKKVIERPI
jgi:hypothetical protein